MYLDQTVCSLMLSTVLVNEDFKEEINANVVDGLHVPHDEMEGVQKGNKETPSLVEIDSPSML
jgi:hypothetical protein